MGNCVKCGQELLEDVKFCTNCGYPVKQPSPIQNPQMKFGDVLLLSTDSVPNHKVVSCLGLVNATWAAIAASRSGLMEAIDAFSGNLGSDTYISYTEEKCYELTIKRIKEIAQQKGCNAIIGLRFNSHFSEKVLRVTAYGTACIIEKNV